jgi:hypothetical protein
MNFFGHAVVAGWFEREPRFVLGSMLPDFATMSGTRLSTVTEARVAEGVALHHRTDDAFHAAPTFLLLSGIAREALEQREVGWGTARAVAHVGTELLLDGVLLTRHASEPYVEALEAAHAIAQHDPLVFGFRDQGVGFELLLRRLRDAGPPHAYREPVRVAEFLERALSRRPRLCFQPGERARVAEVLETLAPEVERQADTLMAHLQQHELLRPDRSHATTAR